MEKEIYILKYEWVFDTFDLFKNINDTHFIQYLKKWDKYFSLKNWKLEDLVGEYPYWDEMLKITLIKKTITL